MSWKGQRSRISFRNLLRNKKTVLIALVSCLVVVGAYGAYVGFHKMTSKAGNPEAYKGVLNYKSGTEFTLVNFTGNSNSTPTAQVIDVSKKVGNRATDPDDTDGLTWGTQTWGSPSNPFLILELTPWQGFSEMGFMIEGCEPVDVFSKAGVYDKQKAAYYRANGEESTYDTYLGTTGGLSWANMGTVVKECFPDEDYPGKGTKKGDADYKYRWFHKSEEKTIKGYYECVKGLGAGYEGTFSITGIDEKGRPVFSKQDGGDFVWVSLGGEAPNYDYHKQTENKKFKSSATVEDMISAYATGDREYTTRTDSEYYFMPNVYQVDEDGTVYQGDDLKPKSKFIHYNDFLRYTLRIRTMKAVDDFCVVIKPVDPVELNAHPEWIDYVDLIYIHISSESGIANNHTKGATELQTFNKALLTTKQTESSTFYTEGNDLTWEVAEKLYMKANGLAKYEYGKDGDIAKVVYDYTGNGRFGYAPVIIGKTIIDTLNGGSSHSNPTYYMNYETMTIQKKVPSGSGNVRTETTGRNNNFYKFCIMDLLMNQDVFYDLFYRPLDSTGQPIIQTQKVNGVETGVSVAQEGDAQYFWCPATFLPYVEKIVQNYGWETEDGKKLKAKYGINQYSNAFMNFPGSAIVGYTFIYNSNNTIFVLGTGSNLDGYEKDENGDYIYETDEDGNFVYETDENGDVIYETDEFGDIVVDENGDPVPKKKRKEKDFTEGATGWYEKNRGEDNDSLNSLEIMDFLLNSDKGSRSGDTNRQELKLRVLDVEPASDYTYLTATALRALFPSTKYKVSFKITHMTTAELNGNKKDLVANYDVIYVGTGTGKFNLVDDSTVYNDDKLNGKVYVHVGDSVETGDGEYRTSGDDLTSVKRKEIEAFAKTGKVILLDDPVYNGTTKIVSKGTNVLQLAENIAQKKYKNVVSLDDLRLDNSVEFPVGKAEIKMKSLPTSYKNSAVADSGDNYLEALEPDTDGRYRLSFTFTMGYEACASETYAARFLIDRNGDGIITDNEAGADVVDTWGDGSGTIYIPGSNKDEPMLNEDGEPMYDKNGELVYEETPKEYTASYVIPEDYENGPIAWKFVLYATDNNAICYEWTGVSLYRGQKVSANDEDNEITIYVDNEAGEEELQTVSRYTDDGKKRIIRILQVTTDTEGNGNLEKSLGTDSLFKTYGKDKLDKIADYVFEFKTISLADYVSGFTNQKYSKSDFTVKVGKEEKIYSCPRRYLTNYDVFLFDCGKELEKADNSDGAVYFASWLADKGYSVVFTNDSVYYDATDKNALSALKDSTGLSRFTATSDYASKYVDTPYNQAGSETAYKSNIENLEFTYHKALVNAKSGNKYKTYGNDLWQNAKGSAQANLGSSGGLDTTEVTQTNLGTVCTYPYTIDANFDITDRQAQEYQLNLENPLATVWYCLGRTNADGTDNSFYTISPNDASNNYYLYGIGNIYYCGIDLSKANSGAAKDEQEIKLFVNLLMGVAISSYPDPDVVVDHVYNRELTDGSEDEFGPVRWAGIRNEWPKKTVEERKEVVDRLDNALVVNSDDEHIGQNAALLNHYYCSLITLGEVNGKNFRYKLYQMPTNPSDPDNDDTIILNGASTLLENSKMDSKLLDGNAGAETEDVKVIKTSYFDSTSTNWSGTTKISEADLNAMKSTDELRIYYNCPEENLEKNTISANGGASQQYEMSSEDVLLELTIGVDPWGNTMTAYVYADDNNKAKEEHIIALTKGELEDYITEVAKKNNRQLTPNSDGEFVFYDITIKKSDGVPYTPSKSWGHQDYWDNGTHYIKDTENPLAMKLIGIYQLDEIESQKKSNVSDITVGALYPPASSDGKVQGDTHRIYFTPDSGDGNEVKDLRIYFARKDGNNLVRTRYYDGDVLKNGAITEVYREKTDDDGNVTGYTKIANKEGVYSSDNGGALKSGVQYFLTYDKKLITMADSEGTLPYEYIVFEISNEKSTSKTILHLSQLAETEPEDVYLFNLD